MKDLTFIDNGKKIEITWGNIYDKPTVYDYSTDLYMEVTYFSKDSMNCRCMVRGTEYKFTRLYRGVAGNEPLDVFQRVVETRVQLLEVK